LQSEEYDLRINRTGRFQQIGPVARVHFGLVGLAKGVEYFGTRLQQPAPTEHLARQIDRTPCDLRRLQVVERTADAIGNAVNDESLVFRKFRLGPEWILPAGTDG